MFENKMYNDIYATRYIISWIYSGGSIKATSIRSDFGKWLQSLELSDEAILHILNLAANGKLELQESAKAFIKTQTHQGRYDMINELKAEFNSLTGR